jgi:hypothetical protein
MANGDNVQALAQTLMQLVPTARRIVDGLRFLFDQPVVREPYFLGTSAPNGSVVAAGAVNVPQLQSDFSHSLEYPFEVDRIRFSNDPSHTFRDWRVRVVDQTFNHEWMKSQSVMVETMVDANTGFYELRFPWIIRTQGGGQNWFVDNLDPVNPINVSIVLHGHLLIPSRGQ